MIFGRMKKSRDIGGLTDFLVGNSLFRNLALGFHQKKRNLLSNIESYLDKEIMGKSNNSSY
jgi:hypothetical protein